MITFRCDACGTSMIARPDQIGGQQTCPMCGGIVVVPEASDPDATPIKVEATPIGMFTYQLECPRCHETQNFRASSLGADMKCRNCGFNMLLPPQFHSECPRCHETQSFRASPLGAGMKCRNCGFNMQANTPAAHSAPANGALPALGMILFAVLNIVIFIIEPLLGIIFGLFIVLPVFLILAVVSYQCTREDQNREDAYRLEDIFMGCVKEHLDTLALKRFQLLRPDEYGAISVKRWMKHLEKFAEDVVWPRLQTREAGFVIEWQRSSRGLSYIDHQIELLIADKSASLADSEDKVEAMSGIEFEDFCMKRLHDAGWEVRSTKASGDQGVDILARKNAISIAIQCKRAAHPIGNAAVQEVFAGSKHFRTDHAAVISNSPYTNSAQELAYSTNVLLLHYSDITKLDTILGREE